MQTPSKFQLLARAGYTARAAVFFLVGGLALFSGIADGKSDTESALDSLLEQPFGRVWVGLIAAGLIGFVVWRMAQSLGNADNQNHDAKGTAIRIGLFGSALAYIGLAYYAIDRAAGLGGQGDNGGEKGLAEWIMSQPAGQWLAGAIGIGFIIGGIVTIAKGVLRVYDLTPKHAAANRSWSHASMACRPGAFSLSSSVASSVMPPLPFFASTSRQHRRCPELDSRTALRRRSLHGSGYRAGIFQHLQSDPGALSHRTSSCRNP